MKENMRKTESFYSKLHCYMVMDKVALKCEGNLVYPFAGLLNVKMYQFGTDVLCVYNRK